MEKNQSLNNGYLVDSNVWIGYYKKDDTLHQKSVELLQEIEEKQLFIIVTNFVVQEVFSMLSYGMNNKVAINFFHFVIRQERIHCFTLDDFWMEEAIADIEEHTLSPSLSMTDISLLTLGKRLGIPLMTFDKKLMNAYKRLQIPRAEFVSELRNNN